MRLAAVSWTPAMTPPARLDGPFASGTSGDNARTEGFFGTMKQELLKGRPVVSTMTVAQMRDYIDTYIDFYIHRRLKSTLGDGYTTIAEHRQALSA